MGLVPCARSQGSGTSRQAIDGRPGRLDDRISQGSCAYLDYGNNIRQMAKDEGVANAFAVPGFVPAYIRPLFCSGIGPFRWVALSGDPEEIYRTDAKVKALLPDNVHLHNWLDMARTRIKFQGLPARICWVGLETAIGWGWPSTRWWPMASWKAPIVIGRDHLDSGSVASPNRETEAMKDGSDAVSDWPILNAEFELCLGCHLGFVSPWRRRRHRLFTTRRSGHRGGRHTGGRPPAWRVLWNDPATGVMRHADAGYADAVIALAKRD